MAKSANPAAGPEAPGDLVAVDVDGMEVVVDMGFVRSWKGIRQAGRMASTELSDQDRFVAMISYYENAIDNMDAVTDAIGDLDPKEAVSVLSRAVKAATSKN